MRGKRGTVLIFTGLLLIAAALCLTGYNLFEEHRADRAASQAAAELEALIPAAAAAEPAEGGEEEIPDYLLNPKMEMPVQSLEGQDYIGVLEVPALGLELPVISQWSYPRLRKAPCRYSGSAYTDDLIIAAHNFRSHFGGLKNLGEGETVRFTDVDGNVFTYAVAVRETLEPTAIEEMESGDWDLTLFTCTPGGSYRVTVRCERTEE